MRRGMACTLRCTFALTASKFLIRKKYRHQNNHIMPLAYDFCCVVFHCKCQIFTTMENLAWSF